MDDPKDMENSIFQLQQEINRLFRDLLSENVFFDRVDFPVVDIIETEDSVRIEIEVPGLNKEDFKVRITGDILVMEGRKVDREKADRINYICMERRFGYFKRAISLPVTADTSSINACHEKGVLIITFPKITGRNDGVKKIEIE